MKTKRNKRGKISHDRYTETIVLNKGVAKDANEKVTKTITRQTVRLHKGRTFGDMVYEFAK